MTEFGCPIGPYARTSKNNHRAKTVCREPTPFPIDEPVKNCPTRQSRESAPSCRINDIRKNASFGSPVSKKSEIESVSGQSSKLRRATEPKTTCVLCGFSAGRKSQCAEDRRFDGILNTACRRPKNQSLERWSLNHGEDSAGVGTDASAVCLQRGCLRPPKPCNRCNSRIPAPERYSCSMPVFRRNLEKTSLQAAAPRATFQTVAA